MFSVDYVNQLRAAEIDRVARLIAPGARVLEIGAGTGRQTLALLERGFRVEPIELPQSNYAGDRLTAVTEYDGKRIPFPDASFDVVYSSSVLEHVADLAAMHSEICRVLAPHGRCIHVLPTHAWRLWTIVSGFGAIGLRRALRPERHGERGSALTELWSFHPRAWRRHFRTHGFEVVHDEPMGLFYTGHLALAERLTLAQRARLAAWMGSACHLFELRPLAAF